MKITINPSDVKKAIRKYYKEVENTNVNIEISTYDEDRFNSSTVIITAVKNININGLNIAEEEIITNEKLKEIFSYILNGEYEIESLYLSSEYQTEGYFMNERTKLNFTSLNMEVIKNKDKVKKLGGQK